MSTALTTAEINQFIRSRFPAWDESRSLMKQLSSIELVDLVDSLEKKYGVRFTPLDLDEEHFQNTSSLLKQLETLKARGA